MDTRDKRSDAVLDDILAELKGKGAEKPKANDRLVDSVLSEIGLGEGRAAPRPPVSRRTAPAAAAGEKTLPARPAAKPEPKAASPAAGKPRPAPEPKAPPPAAEKPPEPAAPAVQDAAPEVFAPVAPPPKPARAAGDTTMVWENGEPRLGKAAAMDSMDMDKFTNDSELMSWYSGESEIYTSRREQRRAEKARKKRQAAEKKRKPAPEPEPEPDEDDFFSLAPPEEPEAAEPPKGWQAVPGDDVVTGSAFDEPAGEDWQEDGSLFDAAPVQDARPDGGPTLVMGLPAEEAAPEEMPPDIGRLNTKSYEIGEMAGGSEKTPTAAYTQEFDAENRPEADTAEGTKSLFVDEMVDDRFREFFRETVVMDREDLEQAARQQRRRKQKKGRTTLLTGELSRMVESYEEAEEEAFDDYNRPQDAEQVEKDIGALRTTMTRRTVLSGVLGLLLLWLGLGYLAQLPLPGFLAPAASPLAFSITYLVLVTAVVVLNFTTLGTGLAGLFGQATVDTPPALAGLAGLLQAVLLVMQVVLLPQGGELPRATLFGGVVALVLACNTLGKRVRVQAVLENFRLASAGIDHSAAYVLDNSQELAYHITRGLQEENPTLLVSRPTALVKGFLRQSFSRRRLDGNGRVLGWVLLAVALLAGGVTYAVSEELLLALSALAAVLCLGAPFSSTLVSAVPSAMLQRSTSKVGAVVPGWSAIEELGAVNVVQAGARDIFPPSSVLLKGIKTFQKERVDLAILYAASVLIEGCDTMRDIFLGVIQGKSDMLYKVESLSMETGRGFTAWVENSRVVVGTRELLQKYDITPPPMEVELRYTSDGYVPVYLAVSGKLFAMFVMAYAPDPEVKDTLDSLVRSGVSLLITSEDMNVTAELIESVYGLPPGVIKVLGRRELELMEPLTAYLPESDGVMTHLGTFASFIGGMRAAAGCAAAERMSGIVQLASVVFACLLCLLLMFSGSLANLSVVIVLLYQLAWTVLVSALPFARRY